MKTKFLLLPILILVIINTGILAQTPSITTRTLVEEDKPTYWINNGTSKLEKGNMKALKTSMDLMVKFRIAKEDEIKYDEIKIFLNYFDSDNDISSMDANDRDNKKNLLNDSGEYKEYSLWIFNPKNGNLGEGDFIFSNSMGTNANSIFGGVKWVKMVVMIVGYKKTGTKKQWNASDQSWYTVPTWDEGTILIPANELTIEK